MIAKLMILFAVLALALARPQYYSGSSGYTGYGGYGGYGSYASPYSGYSNPGYGSYGTYGASPYSYGYGYY